MGRVDTQILVLLTQPLRPAWRLVCFPWAGAGASAFFPWAPLLPSDVQLLAVRLPGRESRLQEAVCASVAIAASSVSGALAELEPLPAVWFGHSLGAWIAFEAALQTQRAGGGTPSLLIPSAAVLPSEATADPDCPLDDDALCSLMDAAVASRPRLRAVVLRALRADVAMARRYLADPAAMLDVPIVAYAGRDDAGLSAETITSWALHTRQTFRVRWFESDHHYLRSKPECVVRSVVLDARSAVFGPAKAASEMEPNSPAPIRD